MLQSIDDVIWQTPFFCYNLWQELWHVFQFVDNDANINYFNKGIDLEFLFWRTIKIFIPTYHSKIWMFHGICSTRIA